MLAIRPTDTNGQGRAYATAKTPGRARNILAQPRTLMKENATRQAFITQTGKPTRTAFPYTPAPKGHDTIEPQRLFEDKLSLKPSTSQNNRLPGLVDKTNKTPFHARLQPFPVTPAPAGKLDLGATPTQSLQVPGTILRPSSTRKSLRIPRKSFETPDARGRRPHWDVSDVDISVELVSSSEVEAIAEEEGDDDDYEIEYCPPSYPEPDYDPGFEMPDYKVLGAAIMAFSKCPTIGEGPLVDWDALQETVEELPAEAPRVLGPDPDDPFPTKAGPSVPKINKPAGPVARSNGRPATSTGARQLPPSRTSNTTGTTRSAAPPAVRPRPTIVVTRPNGPPARSPIAKAPVSKPSAVSRAPSSVGSRTTKPAPSRLAVSRPSSEVVILGADLRDPDLVEFRFEL